MCCLFDCLNFILWKLVESHSGGITFYIQVIGNILGGSTNLAIISTIAMFTLLSLTKEIKAEQNFTFLTIFSLVFLCPLILFSFVPTKLGWYIYPGIIGLYFLVGYAVNGLFTGIMKNRRQQFIISGTCLLLLIIGLIVNPNPDICQIASTSSCDSIFSKLKDNEFEEDTVYYMIHPDGSANSLPQSWILHGYFSGMIPQKGDYNAFMNDNNQNKSLLVSYESPELLAKFFEKNDDLYLVIDDGESAFFVLKE
ncbi:MAG: hypothetical protein LBV27_06310 [Oscillospiraceae bacterium]|nr:hypothetical protein [Oscillospiraceae bacterium]